MKHGPNCFQLPFCKSKLLFIHTNTEQYFKLIITMNNTKLNKGHEQYVWCILIYFLKTKVRIINAKVLNCFFLNSVMMATWVALPSAGGMGETTSLNIRVWVKRRADLETNSDLQQRKWMREFPHVWWQTTMGLNPDMYNCRQLP
jgi:hypothetical protein